jgi:hypothetical protein
MDPFDDKYFIGTNLQLPCSGETTADFESDAFLA